MSRLSLYVIFIATAVVASGCGGTSSDSNNAGGGAGSVQLSIVSGSENKALEPLIHQFAEQHNAQITVTYKGSVDIALELEGGSQMAYDAVWPANSLWLTLGDQHRVIKHEQSIMTSPVIFGVKRSVAERLGWIGAQVTVADILAAAEAGNLRFAMTSATQSNSGASAYFGFLNAMAGQPQVLTMEHLDDQTVQEQTSRLLKQVERSSGSSGWLMELMLERYADFDAMVNYEALIIEANQQLVQRGDEPLIAIYPVDGMMIADSPLAYVNKGDAAKEALFQQLQAYLKSEPVQDRILALGRRTGIVGLTADRVDASVFNPDWGIDVATAFAVVPTPAEPVIRRALDLYQGGGLRKPSATAFILDYSGSMSGEGEAQLERAMAMLLDPEQSTRLLLQPSADDVHIVIPFDSRPRQTMTVVGNDRSELANLLRYVEKQSPDGGTDIFASSAAGIRELAVVGARETHNLAVILMTDGRSKGQLADIQRALGDAGGLDIPVFCIAFGAADDRQLREIAQLTGARVFRASDDLRKAFRKAKGYN